MKSDTVLIFAGDSAWQVIVHGADGLRIVDVDVESAGASKPVSEAIAEGVVSALKKCGKSGAPVILALPSAWCMAALIPTEGLPQKNRRSPMLYRLESKLPVAAEDLAVDFYPEDPSGMALGVAIETRRLSEIIQTFESRGIEIQAICPMVLLAVQMRLEQGQRNDLDAILWGVGNRIELVMLSDGIPTHWYSMENDPEDVRCHLDLHAARLQRSVKIEWANVDVGDLRVTDPANVGSAVRNAAALLAKDVPHSGTYERSTLEAGPGLSRFDLTRGDSRGVVEWAAMALKKGTQADIDLRRDGLAGGNPLQAARGALMWAASALVAMGLVVIGLIVLRANRYHQLAADYESRQAEIFRQVLPGRPVPVSIKSRLVSESRKLGGVSGGSAELPARPATLVLLHEVLKAFPEDSRFRVRELRLNEGRIYVEGDARSHAEADAVAAGLRAAPGLQIDAPQTEQTADKLVNFVINGSTAVAERKKPQAGER